MTDTAGAPVSDVTTETTETQATDTSNADGIAALVAETKHDFVQDKYRTEGRTEDEAMTEQAKAYVELQKQFGGFTGSPDAYEVSLSEELTEQGFEIDTEDPLFVQFSEMAKENGMNNDVFNNVIGAFAMSEIAKETAAEESMKAELATLDNAENRIDNISKYLSANLDQSTFSAFENMTFSADMVKVLEGVIMKGQPATMAPTDVHASPAMSKDELNTLQFAKDDYGNRKMAVDPEYRKHVEQLIAKAYPGENRKVVG
jgi:hypothetical protein